jgi:hypothetical protein
MCFGDGWRWICTIPACFNSLNGIRTLESVLCFCIMSGENCVVGWKCDTEVCCKTSIRGSVLSVSFELPIPETETSSFTGNFRSGKGSISSVPFILLVEMHKSCVLLRVPARTNNSRIPVISVEQKSSVFVPLCIPTVILTKVGWWWMMNWEPFRKDPLWPYWSNS